MNNKVLFVEKKNGFDVESHGLLNEFKEVLNIKGLEKVRIINKYIIQGMRDEKLYESFKNAIFSEKNVDMVYEDNIDLDGFKAFAVEFVPGQFDQRANAAEQCMELLSEGEKSKVKCAKVVAVLGNIDEDDLNKIKKFYINPVDSRETDIFNSEVDDSMNEPQDVEIIEGLIDMDLSELKKVYDTMSLSMTFEDFKLCQEYFINEKRNPTKTEILVLDTYWSDHCRHTTFSTIIENVEIEDESSTKDLIDTFNKYKDIRKDLGREHKDVTLMDIATIGVKELKAKGYLKDLDESEEINACTIKAKIESSEGIEDSLILFKNETHNHPTEIEPFGGAATCLGGAIRDPLSGRAYVYGAMRVTGSADPRKAISETLDGKLPQRVITKGAAKGYSSYGNQIGLTTGEVSEIYHEDYVAKRMEVGAVIGVAPRENVRREEPVEGDVVLLLGGRTGRDGCGGATGSSKEHSTESINLCGAEVQKGNPVEERKIQRFFKNKEASLMIKRCNDFGAAGVSVAVGELCDGLVINLDAVPKKYEGLDGTELAISESQERMAVVVEGKDAERFIKLALEENLECTKIADVTSDNTLTMTWRGKTIVSLNRNFLNTNGAKSYTKVKVKAPSQIGFFNKESEKLSIKESWTNFLEDLNVCSQKGLVENFDSTIGARTVLMPFGGKHRLTPSQGLAIKVPVTRGESHTASIMTYGFNPYISKWSPYHGALYSVVESVCKIAALGGDYKKAYLSFQEYFERLGSDETRWGKPFAALLGALKAQLELGLGAIGGKDSMSGTFEDIDVPPTLISFAVALENVDNVVSQELKSTNSKIALIKTKKDSEGIIDFQELRKNLELLKKLIDNKTVISAMTLKEGGIAEGLSKMAFGNKIGVSIHSNLDEKELFKEAYGCFLVELENNKDEGLELEIIAETTYKAEITYKDLKLTLDELIACWEKPLNSIFPAKDNVKVEAKEIKSQIGQKKTYLGLKKASPKIIIPAFPGTNCEEDSKRAFEKVGGEAEILIFKNIKENQWQESIEALRKAIKNSQILMLPGGFSAGDEPDGSGKFIANVLKNPAIKEEILDLINNRDGLILGICNGFQALIKVGLLPYGDIRDIDESAPTLTFNNIGRHMSSIVNTKVVSKVSPWFNEVELGHINSVAISHGEGRFVASEEMLNELIKNGQVATQYVDLNGNVAQEMPYNPNGSIYAIEGITSLDGRILGKMGHNERSGYGLYKNIPGDYESKIFLSGVNYFTK